MNYFDDSVKVRISRKSNSQSSQVTMKSNSFKEDEE